MHDTLSRLTELRAERAEHEAVLATRPPERLRHLRNAERKLAYALKNREEAIWRLANARRELADLGGLSQLRRRGRHDKAAVLERIGRFEDDVQGAEGAVRLGEERVGDCRREVAREVSWGVQHGWRGERLGVVEAEIAGLQGNGPTPSGPLVGRERPAALLRRRVSQRPTPDPRATAWERRLAEIAAPPRAGRDTGLDIGL